VTSHNPNRFARRIGTTPALTGLLLLQQWSVSLRSWRYRPVAGDDSVAGRAQNRHTDPLIRPQ